MAVPQTTVVRGVEVQTRRWVVVRVKVRREARGQVQVQAVAANHPANRPR